MTRLVRFCAIFLICTLPCMGQAQHDRIDARGQVKTDRFVNRSFILITGATPSVLNGNAFKTNNGGAVTITNFLNGVDTQEVDVLCGDSNTTIQNNSNIAVTGGTNFTCTVNVGISFRYDASQPKWIQFGGTGSGGGGGGTPGAPTGSFQCNSGAATFVACHAIDDNTNITLSEPLIAPNGGTLNGTFLGSPLFSKTGNEALKSVVGDAIQYVSPTGNDANDGLSWGTSKATIYGAIIALPGGSSNVMGSGTIFAMPNSVAHPTAGCGIWLMGGGDPNYASPPACWIKYTGGAIELVGVGATTPGILVQDIPYVPIVGGSTADRNHPSLWISGMQGTFIARNVAFSGSQRPIVFGECSNNSRTTVGCQVFGFTYERIKATTSRINNSSGPTVDLPNTTSGRFINCTFVGTAGSVTALSDNEANILQGTSTNQGGSLSIQNLQLFYGGVKVLGNTQASLNASNIDQYGDFANPMPPTIWFTNYGPLSVGYLQNITRQDPAPTQKIIRVDTTTPFANGPVVIGGFETTGIQGPATKFMNTPYYYAQATNQDILSGHTGFINNYIYGETNVARRIAGFVPIRFTNRAFASPASYTSAGNTLTTGQTDPFGGTSAVKAHTVGVGGQTVLLSSAVAYTPQIGDWIIGGIWSRQVSPFISGAFVGVGLLTGTATISTSKTVQGPDGGDGEWQWQYAARKVSANSAATTVQLTAAFVAGNDVLVYGPVLYIIPAAQISDDEALWFAQSMNTHDTACGVGTICNTSGHPMQFAPDTFAGLGSPPNGTFTHCVDCKITNPCTGSGTGAFAKRLNGAWVCTGGDVNSSRFSAAIPGALTTTWTGETLTLDKAITVTRIQAQLRTAPAGCSTNAIVRLTDGSSNINLTLTAAANDSGLISQNYPATAALLVSVQTAAAACSTSPGDANVIVQYTQ